MLPVNDGSVIAATTPIIVSDKSISAMVKAAQHVIASDQRERGNPLEDAALFDWIATSLRSSQ